ncbi:LysE/ArgO family amino acid transporter [Acetobacterium woodii]|uniref:Putative L-lysine permease LysE n=1 Tax=Acetobacterium woodii (strain ATCC 29683 / DSM 1030 / JCM 2381 / KCTC 1655 / WB1) TaxID=931626 RepID=H6LKU2_ACEWD|nr:LysE family transporter [Acetobacterium woodii]AFA50051.1 putative L-lysine permease LysE [Acetobacterium woodii DSM 1030]
MYYFLQGTLMGFAYVAPIGMQNMFVINGALAHSRKQAVLVGLSVAFFDVTLALSCFYGIGALMDHYDWLKKLVLLIGSLIIIYIGISLIKAKTDVNRQESSVLSLRKLVVSAFVVTWFNPQALIDGTMMLGAFRVSLPTDDAHFFIIGVAFASFIWFNGLALTSSFFGNLIKGKVLRYLNLACGSVIIIYGLLLMLRLIQMIV